MPKVLFHVIQIECSSKSFWELFINYYLCKLISFANDSILWFFLSELSNSNSFTSTTSKKKENVTFSAEKNTFIWSLGNLVASTDHVKGKPLEVSAVKDPELGAFVRRYHLTSFVAKLWMERKFFKKGIN